MVHDCCEIIIIIKQTDTCITQLDFLIKQFYQTVYE